MATDRALAALQNAINELESFANEPGCEWCQEKADELRNAMVELQEVLPIAEQMKQKVDVLARQNITSIRRDILDAKQTLTSTDPFELADSPLLRQAGRREIEPTVSAPPKPMDPALSSPSIFDLESFKEAAEFFRVRPMLKEMRTGLRDRKLGFTVKARSGISLTGFFD